MSVVMKVVFSLSLSGSVLILILLLCKPLFRERLSRQWQYYIWLVVIARLIFPAAPERSVVGTLFSRMNQAGRFVVQSTAESKAVHTAAQGALQKKDTVIQYRESGLENSRMISISNLKERLLQNLWIPWLVTAVFLLLRRITLYQDFVRYVRGGHAEAAEPDVLDRLAKIGECAGVRRPVELYVNSQAASPLLIGFFRPCIVLPTVDLPAEDFSFTVQHELMHYRRKDMFYKWLVQFAVCLHWFNPLVWLMGREISRACELSCDEAVVRTLGEEGRRAYGDTLLRAMGTGGEYKVFPVSVTLNESAKLLKERLGAIMKLQKRSRLATTISIVSAAAMMMGATVMGAYVEPVRTAEIAHVMPVELPGESASDAHGEEPQSGSQISENETVKGTRSLEELAVQYYETGMVSQFGAVFSAMDRAAQRRWLDKVYTDDDSSFFSTAIWRLGDGSPLIGEYAERSYADGNIDLFAIVMWSLDGDNPLIQKYAERAYADDAISFFSVLADAMSPDLLESWQDRVRTGETDLDFQSVLLDASEMSLWTEKTREKDEREYQKWGITREGENYYYQNELVRVFFDHYDGEQVIRTLNWNTVGTVDVKVTRSVRNEIIGVAYMTGDEVAELFDTEELIRECETEEEIIDEIDEKDFDPHDVHRMDAEELPGDVAREITDDGNWYVYHTNGRQYLCCIGFAWDYGYRLEYDENGWRIDIQRFQEDIDSDVFLELPDNEPVTVYCDGEAVELTEILLFTY